MRVQVVRSAADLSADRWNELAEGSVYGGHGWLRYQETDSDSEAWYVVVTEGERWLAATSVYLVHREANPNYSPVFRRDPSRVPHILVGNRRGYSNRLLLADGVSGTEALPHLVDAVHALADEHSDGRAWWPYLAQDSLTALLPWLGHTVPWLLDGDCTITLPGEDFEDFLASSSAGVRKRVRRDRMLFERAGYRTAELRFADCWDEVARLVANLERRHGHEAGTQATGRLLRLQSETMGSAGRVDACFRDDVIVGANVRFDGDREVVSRACGFDYDHLLGACEYFELAYYRAIEAAYQGRGRRLGLGIGTYETKIRRGALVDLRWMAMTGVDGSSSERSAREIRTSNRDRLGEMRLLGLREDSLVEEPNPEWI